MNFIEFLNLLVRLPDGGQAGSLRCHDIDADTEIRTQGCNAGADKLHHLILYIAILKDCADDRQRNVLRADALDRRACQINADNSRHINIIGLVQQLLYKFRASLADRHGSQRAVSCMGVRTQNHAAACCEHFSRKLMDDSLMRRNIDTAILLCAGQSKHVVIFVDRTADRTQGVVTVRQDIGHRELLQSGCSRRLDDTYECDVMAGKLVKADLELFHVPGCVMALQNAIRDCLLRCILFRNGYSCLAPYGGSRLRSVGNDLLTADQKRSAL